MNAPVLRVGEGWDVHRLVEGRPLVLGGVTIPHSHGLLGHSDADALAHAITDALLGAAGLGDIGRLFPDSDPAHRDADSWQLLRAAAGRVHAAGWQVVNVDCSVVCDAPRIGPHRDEMQRRLSDAAGGLVTVKGKRPEGLGALGRNEGIACWAVALIERAEDPT